jgi:hypothetical protein
MGDGAGLHKLGTSRPEHATDERQQAAAGLGAAVQERLDADGQARHRIAGTATGGAGMHDLDAVEGR